MVNWKYIIFGKADGTPAPIIFPSSLNHSDILSAMKAEFPGWQPLTAGSIFGLHVSGAGGGSVTIKLPSEPEHDMRYLNIDERD